MATRHAERRETAYLRGTPARASDCFEPFPTSRGRSAAATVLGAAGSKHWPAGNERPQARPNVYTWLSCERDYNVLVDKCQVIFGHLPRRPVDPSPTTRRAPCRSVFFGSLARGAKGLRLTLPSRGLCKCYRAPEGPSHVARAERALEKRNRIILGAPNGATVNGTIAPFRYRPSGAWRVA